ncbi:MAG: Mannuronate-specific alginate lyase, partial [Bacteroidota bacterium]
MKTLLYTLLAILALASCSKEEEVVTPPAPNKYTLTVSAETGGTVSTEGGLYNEGSKITVTATPDGMYLFKEWSDGSTQNPREITVTSNLTLKASFIKKTYPLAVTVEGEGTVSEEVIVQGSTTETEYNAGTTVRLTATPNEGWVFAGWSGDVESEELVIEVLIEKGTSLVALFIKDSIAISIDIRGNGKINNSIENYQIVLNLGESISLQAESTDDHSIFLGWSGDLITSENPLIIAPESNLNLIANFLDKESIQNIGITGEGEIVFDSYIYNDSNNEEIIGFEVRALPKPGYSFRGWNGISTLFYGGVEVSKNPIEIDLTQRLNNGPLDAFFVPEDGNYEEIKTLFQIIKYPFDKDGINEILEGTGGAAAGAAFYENETGKYIIFMPNYPNNYVSSKDGLPRMGATIYRLEDDG